MGKPNKQQLQEYNYDEASSGSDDSDSSDDENDDEYSVMSADIDSVSKGEGKSSEGSESEREEASNGNDSSDEEKEEEDPEESSSDEDDAPLQERILKKESKGRAKLASRRQQKSRALEEATKRLAALKRERKTQVREGTADEDDERPEKSSGNKQSAASKTRKKKNKHKPTEVSSKRADFYGRGARRLNESGLGVDIGAHRYKPMDPRLSNLTGHFDEDRFHHNYAFLEEMRNKEIGQVRKRIAAHRATGNKGNRLRRKAGITQADGSHSSTLEEDVARLKSLTQSRADLERRKIDRAAKQSVKRKIREDVESGKSGAYFLKRKEKKRLELEARFEEIRKRKGEKGVEKILEKKRKKNKSRDASFLSR
ncbi:unnamed protein product [Pseudo-nitzschia multistriata]|uniref:rRNA biogenesis protein RRP36 n=1 Tax=Pseudo-nitzschia multistriata TaxID=183589 RepID=A0A448ZP90_9STRA|nr:unnamed protein product [Pseudo-nitzschia multistriata]